MISKKAAVAAMLLAAVVFIAGCASTQQAGTGIADDVAPAEYAQDSAQAQQSVSEFWDEAYSGSPDDVPDY